MQLRDTSKVAISRDKGQIINKSRSRNQCINVADEARPMWWAQHAPELCIPLKDRVVQPIGGKPVAGVHVTLFDGEQSPESCGYIR